MSKSKPKKPSMTDRVHSYADENEVAMLLCDPQDLYNDAILGVFEDENGHRVVYSKQKMVEALAAAFALHDAEESMKPKPPQRKTIREYFLSLIGISEEPEEEREEERDPVMEAIEFLEFNTFNAYVGDHGPIYIDDLSDRD